MMRCVGEFLSLISPRDYYEGYVLMLIFGNRLFTVFMISLYSPSEFFLPLLPGVTMLCFGVDDSMLLLVLAIWVLMIEYPTSYALQVKVYESERLKAVFCSSINFISS